MVPDDSLTIRERAIAAWPMAWGGQNQRDILVSLGIDVDRPWRELPKEDRDWILFTDEQPVVPVYPGLTPAETREAQERGDDPDYQGTFTSARRHVLHTFANTQSALMKKRVSRYMLGGECPTCQGKRLRRESLSVSFAGLDIAEISGLPLARLADVVRPLRGRFQGRCGGRPPGEGDRRPPDRGGPRVEARGAPGPRPRLPVARPEHAHPLAGRAPAPSARHPGPLEPLRRRVCARRAFRGPPPGGHRGPPAGARPTEGIRQLAVRRRARPRRDPSRRLGGGRRPGRRRARRHDPLQRAARGAARCRGVADPPPPLRRMRPPHADASRAGGLAPPVGRDSQQPGSISTPPSPWACSRP